MADIVRETARHVFVPLTVGGGIRTLEDFHDILRAGADKISVNSAVVRNPQLINQAADQFGSQCVVVAVDARKALDGTWHVVVNGGRIDTGLDALEWVREVVERGAGEILLTSMDTDGCKNGFDLPLTKAVADLVPGTGDCIRRVRLFGTFFSSIFRNWRGRCFSRLFIPLWRTDGGTGKRASSPKEYSNPFIAG